jgi:hypothetical protein
MVIKISILISFLLFHVSAKDFKGAELRTKLSYKYGRFEVRMKSASREGMLSSFFTYYDGGGGTGNWNEIDIEVMGRYNDNVQFNTITPGQVNHVGHYPMLSSLHTDYHIYAFEWTPDYVAWFVDGNEVLKQTGPHIQSLDKAQKVMMNVWNPLYINWAGTFNPNSLPAFAYYDWVKYYSYTPGSGSYGTGNSFTLSWLDDFEYWNTARWEKGSHTWDGNGCDFIHDNAVFIDGKLILCLTNSVNTGYTDVKAPVLLWARASENKVLVTFSEELDPETAQNVGNYIIQAVTVNSAVLLPDLKIVELIVTGMDLITSKNLLVLTMKDDAVPANIMSAAATAIILPQPLIFPVKINCGGTAELGYLPDKAWSEDSEYGFQDGNISLFPASLQINGTDEDPIYRAEKFGMVSYKVRVPNGNYNVKLMFAENYFNSTDSRIFDLYLEYGRAAQSLDVYSKVGKNTAYIAEFLNVAVEDERMDIHFAAIRDNSFINGIIVTPVTTGLNDHSSEVKEFTVDQNYPNPFNGKTVITYTLPEADNISLNLFNILGEKIHSEEMGFLAKGSYTYVLDTTGSHSQLISSGIYFYQIKSSRQQQVRKMILLN